MLNDTTLTDNQILAYFQGNNTMTIFANIPTPTNVPNGGYWLNDVEVDVNQLIHAYRAYSGAKTIVMGRK